MHNLITFHFRQIQPRLRFRALTGSSISASPWRLRARVVLSWRSLQQTKPFRPSTDQSISSRPILAGYSSITSLTAYRFRIETCRRWVYSQWQAVADMWIFHSFSLPWEFRSKCCFWSFWRSLRLSSSYAPKTSYSYWQPDGNPCTARLVLAYFRQQKSISSSLMTQLQRSLFSTIKHSALSCIVLNSLKAFVWSW